MATKEFQLNELLDFQSKSHRKAGDGLESGTYPFFTSSQHQTKWFDEADYKIEAIILGTGGAPSVHCAKNFSTSADVFVLAPKSNKISAKYVAYFLSSDKDILERGFKGAGLKHLSRDYAAKIQIPLPTDSKGNPDVKEQERIVALLEEAEELRKKRAEAEHLTMELLTALFSSTFGDLDSTQLPVKELKDVSEFVTDGTHLPPPFTNQGIPFLFVRNITSGHIDFNTEKFISEESYTKLTKKYRPQKNDILYSTVGSYGIAVLVETETRFSFQRHIGHIRPNKTVMLPEFFYSQLNTAFVRKQADMRVRGVAQKTLNLDELRKLRVVVPTLSQQKEFVSKLIDLQHIQLKQKESTANIDRLFSSLISRAFIS